MKKSQNFDFHGKKKFRRKKKFLAEKKTHLKKKFELRFHFFGLGWTHTTPRLIPLCVSKHKKYPISWIHFSYLKYPSYFLSRVTSLRSFAFSWILLKPYLGEILSSIDVWTLKIFRNAYWTRFCHYIHVKMTFQALKKLRQNG